MCSLEKSVVGDMLVGGGEGGGWGGLFFFFFQAEDGIRDYKVTGVQTCALPILVASDIKFILINL